jgi:hypothetical protein
MVKPLVMNKGLSRRLSPFQRSEAALLLLAGRGGEGERHGGIDGNRKPISLAGHGGEGGIAFLLLSLPLL